MLSYLIEAIKITSEFYVQIRLNKKLFKFHVLAEQCVEKDYIEETHPIHKNLMSWEPIGHNNDSLIKCAILLLKFELVEVRIRNICRHGSSAFLMWRRLIIIICF